MGTAQTFPPGPRGHWLLGSLREFRRDMLGFYTRVAREYGDLASYRLGTHRLVLVNHPELIEQVLVTDNRSYTKHYVLRLLAPTLGNGLLTSEGEFWLRQRRLIQPAFSRQRVDSYAGIIRDHAARLVSSWEDGATRDLHADMMQLALAIVAKALLDVDAGAPYAEIEQPIETILRDFDRRFLSLASPPRWLPTAGNRALRGAVAQLDRVIAGFIAERRADPGDRGDLLSVLVRARDEDDQTGMTDAQLRDEVMTLFLAGHETTANALTWIWYLLARHPQVEARLRTELEGVLGNRLPEAADVPALTYTGQVVHEALRLYPPAYTFGRETAERVTLGGYSLPRGTTVLLSPWVTHRDERFFERPDEFLPERFEPERARQIPRYAYFPFGGGPRGCIGNTFAMLEATLVVATIVPRVTFELTAADSVTPRASVTLRPRDGLRAVIRRR